MYIEFNIYIYQLANILKVGRGTACHMYYAYSVEKYIFISTCTQIVELQYVRYIPFFQKKTTQYTNVLTFLLEIV